MSDCIFRIIPSDPYYRMEEAKAPAVVACLKARISADDIAVKTYDAPVFIDCGENLERITCPVCGAELDFDWWGEAMEAASEGAFMDLSVKLPCCGERSSLNDLCYDFPCGFSCVEVSILNPTALPDDDCLLHIQDLLGTPVRCITAHI